MTKQIQVKIQDGESEKEKASASFIYLVTFIIGIAAAITASYYLFPIIWNAIKFIALFWNMVVAAFFILGLFLANRENEKTESDRGLTNREKIHERRKAKSIAECSEAEKLKILEDDRGMNGWFIIFASSLFLAPLFFGITKQFQFFPANYIAPVATILGFITWVKVTNNTIKIYDHLDEKSGTENGKNLFFYKFSAFFIAVHLGLILIVIIMNMFGINIPTFSMIAG